MNPERDRDTETRRHRDTETQSCAHHTTSTDEVPKLPRNAESAAAAIAEHEPRFDDIEWVRHPPTNSASDAPLPPAQKVCNRGHKQQHHNRILASGWDRRDDPAWGTKLDLYGTYYMGWIYMGRTATSSAPILRAALGRLAPPESV